MILSAKQGWKLRRVSPRQQARKSNQGCLEKYLLSQYYLMQPITRPMRLPETMF
jgi:hypothetical protein